MDAVGKSGLDCTLKLEAKNSLAIAEKKYGILAIAAAAAGIDLSEDLLPENQNDPNEISLDQIDLSSIEADEINSSFDAGADVGNLLFYDTINTSSNNIDVFDRSTGNFSVSDDELDRIDEIEPSLIRFNTPLTVGSKKNTNNTNYMRKLNNMINKRTSDVDTDDSETGHQVKKNKNKNIRSAQVVTGNKILDHHYPRIFDRGCTVRKRHKRGGTRNRKKRKGGVGNKGISNGNPSNRVTSNANTGDEIANNVSTGDEITNDADFCDKIIVEYNPTLAGVISSNILLDQNDTGKRKRKRNRKRKPVKVVYEGTSKDESSDIVTNKRSNKLLSDQDICKKRKKRIRNRKPKNADVTDKRTSIVNTNERTTDNGGFIDRIINLGGANKKITDPFSARLTQVTGNNILPGSMDPGVSTSYQALISNKKSNNVSIFDKVDLSKSITKKFIYDSRKTNKSLTGHRISHKICLKKSQGVQVNLNNSKSVEANLSNKEWGRAEPTEGNIGHSNPINKISQHHPSNQEPNNWIDTNRVLHQDPSAKSCNQALPSSILLDKVNFTNARSEVDYSNILLDQIDLNGRIPTIDDDNDSINRLYNRTSFTNEANIFLNTLPRDKVVPCNKELNTVASSHRIPEQVNLSKRISNEVNTSYILLDNVNLSVITANRSQTIHKISDQIVSSCNIMDQGNLLKSSNISLGEVNLKNTRSGHIMSNQANPSDTESNLINTNNVLSDNIDLSDQVYILTADHCDLSNNIMNKTDAASGQVQSSRRISDIINSSDSIKYVCISNLETELKSREEITFQVDPSDGSLYLNLNDHSSLTPEELDSITILSQQARQSSIRPNLVDFRDSMSDKSYSSCNLLNQGYSINSRLDEVDLGKTISDQVNPIDRIPNQVDNSSLLTDKVDAINISLDQVYIISSDSRGPSNILMNPVDPIEIIPDQISINNILPDKVGAAEKPSDRICAPCTTMINQVDPIASRSEQVNEDYTLSANFYGGERSEDQQVCILSSPVEQLNSSNLLSKVDLNDGSLNQVFILKTNPCDPIKDPMDQVDFDESCLGQVDAGKSDSKNKCSEQVWIPSTNQCEKSETEFLNNKRSDQDQHNGKAYSDHINSIRSSNDIISNKVSNEDCFTDEKSTQTDPYKKVSRQVSSHDFLRSLGSDLMALNSRVSYRKDSRVRGQEKVNINVQGRDQIETCCRLLDQVLQSNVCSQQGDTGDLLLGQVRLSNLRSDQVDSNNTISGKFDPNNVLLSQNNNSGKISVQDDTCNKLSDHIYFNSLKSNKIDTVDRLSDRSSLDSEISDKVRSSSISDPVNLGDIRTCGINRLSDHIFYSNVKSKQIDISNNLVEQAGLDGRRFNQVGTSNKLRDHIDANNRESEQFDSSTRILDRGNHSVKRPYKVNNNKISDQVDLCDERSDKADNNNPLLGQGHSNDESNKLDNTKNCLNLEGPSDKRSDQGYSSKQLSKHIYFSNKMLDQVDPGSRELETIDNGEKLLDSDNSDKYSSSQVCDNILKNKVVTPSDKVTDSVKPSKRTKQPNNSRLLDHMYVSRNCRTLFNRPRNSLSDQIDPKYRIINVDDQSDEPDDQYDDSKQNSYEYKLCKKRLEHFIRLHARSKPGFPGFKMLGLANPSNSSSNHANKSKQKLLDSADPIDTSNNHVTDLGSSKKRPVQVVSGDKVNYQVDSNKLLSDNIYPGVIRKNIINPSYIESDQVGPSNRESDPVGPSNRESDPVGPSNRESDQVGPSKRLFNKVGPYDKKLGEVNNFNKSDQLYVIKQNPNENNPCERRLELLNIQQDDVCPSNIMLNEADSYKISEPVDHSFKQFDKLYIIDMSPDQDNTNNSGFNQAVPNIVPSEQANSCGGGGDKYFLINIQVDPNLTRLEEENARRRKIDFVDLTDSDSNQPDSSTSKLDVIDLTDCDSNPPDSSKHSVHPINNGLEQMNPTNSRLDLASGDCGQNQAYSENKKSSTTDAISTRLDQDIIQTNNTRLDFVAPPNNGLNHAIPNNIRLEAVNPTDNELNHANPNNGRADQVTASSRKSDEIYASSSRLDQENIINPRLDINLPGNGSNQINSTSNRLDILNPCDNKLNKTDSSHRKIDVVVLGDNGSNQVNSNYSRQDQINSPINVGTDRIHLGSNSKGLDQVTSSNKNEPVKCDRISDHVDPKNKSSDQINSCMDISDQFESSKRNVDEDEDDPSPKLPEKKSYKRTKIDLTSPPIKDEAILNKIVLIKGNLPYVKERKWGVRTLLPCPECSYSTTKGAHLRRHVTAVHNKSKPYSCTQCDYNTSEKSNLKQHYSSVHSKNRPFSCPQCNYKSSWKKDLERHVKSLHERTTPVKPFKCHLCNYSARRAKYLECHVNSKHLKPKFPKRKPAQQQPNLQVGNTPSLNTSTQSPSG